MSTTVTKYVTLDNVRSAIAVYKQAEEWRTRFKDWRGSRKPWYQIVMDEDEDITGYLYAYLDALPSAGNSEVRSWKALVDYRDNLYITVGGGSRGVALLDGEEVHYSTNADEPAAKGDNTGRGRVSFIVESLSLEAIEKVKVKLKEFAAEINNPKENRPTKLFTHGKWGWQTSDAPLRPLDTVILADEHKEELTSDIRRFLDSEDAYVARGLSWHRGYLLHGPPGTGKTSLIKALAREFKMDTYFLSLNDVRGDNDLYERIHEMRPKTIVMLEDIDTCVTAVDRDADSNITTAALLNILDGIFTPHGMICFLTSNYPERLDPAIVRPGRVDYKLKLDYCDSRQVDAIYHSFYDRAPEVPFIVQDGEQLSPAAVVDVLKRNMYDPVAGERELHGRNVGEVVA